MSDPQREPSRDARSAGASPLHANLFGWKRWVAGVGVVFTITLLLAVPAALAQAGPEKVALRVVLVLVGAPALMLSLSVSFSWAARSGFGSARKLFTSLAVASAVGATFGLGVRFVLHNVPRDELGVENPVTYLRAVTGGVVFGLFLCAVWALTFLYPSAAEDARLRSLEAEKLKLEAEQLRSAAELARLRAQLEPHFLLNTLNAIAGLVTQDPREARRLLGCLGDLLRDSLRDADEMQTLGEEIAWLRRYAEILESRHAGSLYFRWEIAAEASCVLLPRLLLQPLVENAVKHGALCRNGGGQVVVRAAITAPSDGAAARLVCTVEDNGPGMPANPPRSGALGLRAVRRRLELKCTDAHLRLESSPFGTRSIVELPCTMVEERISKRAFHEVAR